LKAEIERAEERMTLKHGNTSKWAKQALQRGVCLI
jgi:U3 small nucleolar RNA-associated protein 14